MTPIVSRKLWQVQYPQKKLKNITTKLKKVMFEHECSRSFGEENEMLTQQKEKFETAKSWSICRVQQGLRAAD